MGIDHVVILKVDEGLREDFNIFKDGWIRVLILYG